MVENIEHAFAGGPSALEHLIQAMQARHRLVKEHQIKQEPNQLAGGHSAGHHGLAAEPQHQHGAERGKEAHGRIVIGPGAHDAEVSLTQTLGTAGKARVLVILPTVGLDLSDALEVVHQQRVHGAGSLALFAVSAMGGKRVPQRAGCQKRQRRESHRGQGGISVKQNAADAANAENGHSALLGAIDEHAFDIIDVFHHAGH